MGYFTYQYPKQILTMINEKCPGVAINTEEYTTYGFRNCLGCILKNSFSFNGPIISELGKEISTADVYAEYCEEREKVTLDDLKKISSDMNTSIIYWESVREKTIRLKKLRPTERQMTTPLFLLRCVQIGLSIRDLDLLTIGMVNDMYAESSNDDYKYSEVATQEDFDRF